MAIRVPFLAVPRRLGARVFACARGLHPRRSVRSDGSLQFGHVRQQDEAERSARTAVSQWRSRHDHRRAGGSGQGLSAAARSDRTPMPLRKARRLRPRSTARSRRKSRNPSRKSQSARPRTRSAETEKPPSSTPTRIDIGAKGARAAAGARPIAASRAQVGRWPSPPPDRAGSAGRAAVAIDLAGAAATAPTQPAAAPSAAPNSQSGQSFAVDLAKSCRRPARPPNSPRLDAHAGRWRRSIMRQ